MAIDFKFGGTKELVVNLHKYGRENSRRLQDGTTEIGMAIVEETQGNLVDQRAIDTGALFDSYHVRNGTRVKGVRWPKSYYAQATKSGFANTASSVSLAPGISHATSGLNAVAPGRIGAVAGTDARHAAFVEFGTVKMSARPHFGPAVEKVKPKMERLIARESKRIKRIQDVKRATSSGVAPGLSDIVQI